MPAYLSPIGNSQIVDVNGNPLNGGKIYTYLAGTSTPAGTWTTSASTIAQANPIILNSLGATANPIWLTAGVAYKFVIKDSTDVTMLYTFDNIVGINDPSTVANPTPEWVVSTMALSYVAPTIFSAVGDQTTILPIGIRVKTTNTGGIVYSRVANVVFSLGATTVTLINDGVGVLDAGLSALSYSILSPTKPSLPNSQTVRDAMGIPKGGKKNLLINANFQVNQDARAIDAATVLAANEYWFDGWKAGGSGCTVKYDSTFQNVEITAGTLQQIIEVPTRLVNRSGLSDNTFVLSIGGGNIPTATFGDSFSASGTLPLVNKGMLGDSNITVTFGIGTFSKPQLEEGNTPTTFEFVDIQQDLAECQRYYEPAIAINLRLSSGPANFLSTYCPFKVTKRSVPVLTLNAAGTIGNFASEVFVPTVQGFAYNLTCTTINTDTFVLNRTIKVNSRL